MGILNIEIKAKSNNHTAIRKIPEAQKAVFKGTYHQILRQKPTNR